MSDFRLRVFQAVAVHLSFTKAAQELFVTQPAVTKHIHELEKQYSQRLLARRGNRVALTEAGRLLLAHAGAWPPPSSSSTTSSWPCATPTRRPAACAWGPAPPSASTCCRGCFPPFSPLPAGAAHAAER